MSLVIMLLPTFTEPPSHRIRNISPYITNPFSLLLLELQDGSPNLDETCPLQREYQLNRIFQNPEQALFDRSGRRIDPYNLPCNKQPVNTCQMHFLSSITRASRGQKKGSNVQTFMQFHYRNICLNLNYRQAQIKSSNKHKDIQNTLK